MAKAKSLLESIFLAKDHPGSSRTSSSVQFTPQETFFTLFRCGIQDILTNPVFRLQVRFILRINCTRTQKKNARRGPTSTKKTTKLNYNFEIYSVLRGNFDFGGKLSLGILTILSLRFLLSSIGSMNTQKLTTQLFVIRTLVFLLNMDDLFFIYFCFYFLHKFVSLSRYIWKD